jgi:hypothetical protein
MPADTTNAAAILFRHHLTRFQQLPPYRPCVRMCAAIGIDAIPSLLFTPAMSFSIIEKQIKMWLLTTTRLSLMVQACLPHCVMTICSMQYAKNLSACVHA